MRAAFCGHSRVIDREAVKAALEAEIERLIQAGVDEFLSGGYGEFDLLAAKLAKEASIRHKTVRSILVLAYLEQDYDPSYYHETEYPPLENVPKRFAIVRRNEWMVEQADVIVAYVRHSFGGAAKTLDFARRKGKCVLNL